MVRNGLGLALMDPLSIHGADLNGIALVPLHSDINYIVGAVSQSIHVLSDDAKKLMHGLHEYIMEVIPNYQESNPNGLLTAVCNRLAD